MSNGDIIHMMIWISTGCYSMCGSSCSLSLNWLPCVEEDLIVFIFIFIVDVVYEQSHAAPYSN